jgi:integrase
MDSAYSGSGCSMRFRPPLTRVIYARVLEDFFGLVDGQGRPPSLAPLCRPDGPSSVNQKLSAVHMLAAEAARNGLLDPAAAQAIRDIGGAEQHGRPRRNWLTKRKAEALLSAPNAAINQGKRDRAILTVLVGCGLRRDEADRSTFVRIQQREGRWCVVDLLGEPQWQPYQSIELATPTLSSPASALRTLPSSYQP